MRPGPGRRRLPLGLGAALLLVHIALVFSIRTPYIFHDELEYWLMAHQLAAGRWALTWAGAPDNYPSILYPLLIAPLAHLPSAVMYDAARILGCLVMASVSVPVYLLARRLGAGAGAAGWAALLAAAVPSFAFTANIMADPLFYTLFTWAAYGALRVVEEGEAAPSPAGCFGWGLLIGGLYLAKIQGLLAPALLVVAVLWRLAAGGGHPGRAWVARVAWAAAGLAVGLGSRLAVLALSGRAVWPLSAARFLGFYRYAHDLVQAGAGRAALPPVVGLYALLLLVVVGVLPLAALLSPRALRLLRRDAATGTAWAVTVAACGALVLVFARNTLVRNVVPAGPADPLGGLVLQERYLFPVSGLVFALWARFRSRRGGSWATAIAAGLAVVAGIAILHPFLTGNVVAAAPSLMGLMVAATSSHPSVRALLWVAAAGLGATVLAAQRTGRPVFLLALLLMLSAGGYAGTWWVRRAHPRDLAVATAVAATVPARASLFFDQSLPVSVANNVEFWHPAAWRQLTPADLAADLALPSLAPAYAVVAADTAQGVAAVVRDAGVAVVPARAVADGSVPLLDGLDRGTWLEPGSVVFGVRPPGMPEPVLRIGLDGSQPKVAGPQRVDFQAAGQAPEFVTVGPGQRLTVEVPLGPGAPGTPYHVTVAGQGWIPDAYAHNGDTHRVLVAVSGVRVEPAGQTAGA